MLATEEKPTSVWLVARRPRLDVHPLIWRWLARLVYSRIMWTSDYGIEYQGVFTDEAEARWAASAPGMFVMELPLNAMLPEETAQYGKHDFPLSEASSEYRNRRLPFVTLSRGQYNAIGDRIEQVAQNAEGSWIKA